MDDSLLAVLHPHGIECRQYTCEESDDDHPAAWALRLSHRVRRYSIITFKSDSKEAQISRDDLLGAINSNQLLKSQLEALIVSFELVWKLAKVDFVDADKPASAERTGGKRYPKLARTNNDRDKTLYFHLLDVFYYLRGVVIRTRYLLNEIGFRRTCIRFVNKCKRKLRSVSSGVIRKSI